MASPAIDDTDTSNAERTDIDTFFQTPLELEEMIEPASQFPGQADTIQESSIHNQAPMPTQRVTLSTPATRRRKLVAKGRSIASKLLPRRRPAWGVKSEDYPQGYPRVASLLNASSGFACYRRFGYLHSRLLLYKQDQLRELEEELLFRDRADDESVERRLGLISREEADLLEPLQHDRSQAEILKEIEEVLLQYGSILRQTQHFWAMEAPSARNRVDLANHLYENQPIVYSEQQWIEKDGDDLVHIGRETETSNLDANLEHVLRGGPRWLQALFANTASRQKTADQNVPFFADTRIKIITGSLITMLISLLLTIPIFTLWALTTYVNGNASNIACLCVIVACVLALNMVLSIFTKAKRHEIIAAAAGYTAVLVVFISSSSNNNNNNNISGTQS